MLHSFSEGLPLTVIEAQVYGITVFASSNISKEIDCGGVRFIDLSKGLTY